MTDPATARAQKHLLGFAFFGWAWPAFLLAGRILLGIAMIVIYVVAFVIEAAIWLRARLSDRLRGA